MFLVLGALGFVLIGAAAGVVVLLSGTYDTSATRQHLFLTHRLFDTGLRFSVREAAKHVEVPALDGADLRARGFSCYHAHCEECHGAPGIAPGPAARGMLPIPRNLVQTGREWPPAWLYHVIAKGVRMTGMPAWQYRLSERSLWSTVAFVRTLPGLTQETYRAQLQASPSVPCEASADLPADFRRKDAETLFRQHACDTCHVIDGVVGPRSVVGPPLHDWSRRALIAGTLPNTPANLERWIRDPPSVKPRTLMPNLDVPPEHAQAMARYLFAQGDPP